MSLIFVGLSSFMLALSGALVPGPLFTVTVSASLRKGFWAGPLIILGHGLLELGMVFLIVFGLTPIFAEEAVRTAIGFVGGVLVIVMGLMLLKDASKARLAATTQGEDRGMNLIAIGALGSISNPYWLMWWATIGLGYLISALRLGYAGGAAFFIGHISADLAWYSGISFAVSRGREVIGERGYRFILAACGVFLVFFGVWFISGA